MLYTTRISRYSLICLALGLFASCTPTSDSTLNNPDSGSTVTSPTPQTEASVSEPQEITEIKDSTSQDNNTSSTAAKEQKAESTETVSSTVSNNSSSNPSSLSPGYYCYQLETENDTIHVRLDLDTNNNIYGDSRGSVHNEEAGYYTSYARKFSGTLSDNQANLEVITWIEYDLQTEQQTWPITRDTLSINQTELPSADCKEVTQAFQDINGLEASDLLDGATAVHNQAIRFAPGTSAATVSNSVIRGERDLYTLGAQGGQQMTLSISALEENAVFDVISPSGYILTVEARDETVFLPHNGDYQVIVGGTRGNATYELTVGIE